MLKRVLSVALFLTMVFSLVPFASAANDIAKIEFVAVVNSEIARSDLATITAPGGPLGILIPGTNNNEITITAPAPQIARNSFDVVIVFDGVVEKDKGFILVNNKQIKYDDIIQFDDGTSAVAVSFDLIDESVYDRNAMNDWGSSKGYEVIISQTGKATLRYEFAVNYVDSDYTPFITALDYFYAGYVGGFYDAIDYSDSVTGIVTASILNLRSGPSTDNSIIGKLPVGTIVEIVDVTGGWYNVVTASGATGYVFAAYVA